MPLLDRQNSPSSWIGRGIFVLWLLSTTLAEGTRHRAYGDFTTEDPSNPHLPPGGSGDLLLYYLALIRCIIFKTAR
nr:unnamed protein product [Callosobruchus chinensis]